MHDTLLGCNAGLILFKIGIDIPACYVSLPEGTPKTDPTGSDSVYLLGTS